MSYKEIKPASQSTVKAILFDMDGVLIDAREWHYDSLNKALRMFGYEISRYDHLITFDGLPTKQKLEMLTRERLLPRKLHSFINEMKQTYTHELVSTSCKPVFQHQYLLSKLKAGGYKIALCSNSIRSTIESMVTKAGIKDYFDIILSNQDVRESKPSPEIYLTAMNKLDLTHSACLVVEDNENGIKAARASGAHILRVNNVDDVNMSNISKRLFEIEQGI